MEGFVHLCIIFVGFTELQAQLSETSQESGITSFQQLDRNVVDSVLKIVDDKFDSLSERISSLERAVNGLQYYNVRQFKIVNTNLNSVDKILQAMNSQVGLIDVENKGLKISMDSVKRDMKSLEKTNNLMFEAMEQNFNYLNKGFSERLESLQNMVAVINQSSDLISQKIQESSIGVANSKEPNCSLILDKFGDKIDLVINNSISSLQYHHDTSEQQRSAQEVKALAQSLREINDNVKRSITYYHHTGNLVERIVGATETVAEDQTVIRADLREFLEKQTNITNCNTSPKAVPVYIKTEVPNTPQSESLSKCEIPLNTMSEFKQAMKNGSQLVEIVTDLAQTSQISLKTTVVELLKEVHRMKEKEKSTQSIKQPSTPTLNGFIEYDFEMLLNATKGILQMVEAIASHTRWIPYIFHNLQFVESQVNQTLSNSKNIQIVLNQLEKEGSLETANNLTSMINFIHGSAVKLHRITPSLTKLLGEPEPFLVLNGGVKENEGRVEIYKKGKWGTLCGRYGHIEATYICRHMGYMGGNSAGHGYFGAGSGIFWQINVSCLYSRQCDIVKPIIQSENCDHQQDFAVICDHMVRLRTEDDGNSRDSGFLEIHHMEEWTRVCSSGWSQENTRVVCQQLGFEDGVLSSPTTEYIRSTEVPAILNDVNCTGTEIRIDECKHGSWSPSKCASNEDVHLTCS